MFEAGICAYFEILQLDPIVCQKNRRCRLPFMISISVFFLKFTYSEMLARNKKTITEFSTCNPSWSKFIGEEGNCTFCWYRINKSFCNLPVSVVLTEKKKKLATLRFKDVNDYGYEI